MNARVILAGERKTCEIYTAFSKAGTSLFPADWLK